MLNVLIPCAGQGSRFREAGFRNPKPMIDVVGVPMVERAVRSVVPSTLPVRLIFVVTHQDVLEFDISKRLWQVFPSREDRPTYILPTTPTKGAASSCLRARYLIDNGEPLVIMNCDQIVEGGWGNLINQPADVDAAILTFQSDGSDRWSYAKTRDGMVHWVVEKQVISERATVGIYYFARGKDFILSAEQMIGMNSMVNGEFYVAPVYNYLIRSGGRVAEVQVESFGGKMWPVGTPEDLETYLRSHQ